MVARDGLLGKAIGHAAAQQINGSDTQNDDDQAVEQRPAESAVFKQIPVVEEIKELDVLPADIHGRGVCKGNQNHVDQRDNTQQGKQRNQDHTYNKMRAAVFFPYHVSPPFPQRNAAE